MKFLLALLAVLLIEIALFVVIGGYLGLWLTLAWVLLAGALGLVLLKGIAMMGPVSMSRDLFEFRNAQSLMPHRVLVVIAATLLLFPGFMTDFFGLLLLIQPVRRLIIRKINRKFDDVMATATPGPKSRGSVIVDAEWVEAGEPGKPSQPPSDKTLH